MSRLLFVNNDIQICKKERVKTHSDYKFEIGDKLKLTHKDMPSCYNRYTVGDIVVVRLRGKIDGKVYYRFENDQNEDETDKVTSWGWANVEGNFELVR